MQLGTGSKVMLAPDLSWWEESAGRTEDERWCLAPRQISPIGYFHIQRYARGETASGSSSLLVCLSP